jgi:tetratricopeptide (TPR) repeat protein/protein involved in polysaccharide export with SLBB domain
MKKTIFFCIVYCAASAAAFVPCVGAAALQGSGRAAVYYRDGVRYALEGRLNEAAAAFEQAVRLDPKNGDAFYSLGNVYSEQGRWDDAVSAYREAVFLKKKDGEAYNGLGVALGGWGRYEQAAEALKRAIEIYPDWAEPRFHLSLVYKKLGQDVAARVAYSEALVRRPDYATRPPRSFTSDIGKTRTTETGKARGEPRVEPRVEKATAAAPNSVAPALNAGTPGVATPRATDSTRSGDSTRAGNSTRVGDSARGGDSLRVGDSASKVALPESRGAQPDAGDASSQYELGLSRARAGRDEEAVAALRQAVRLDRSNAAAFSALGGAYARLGRWRESVDAYEQAVRLDPKDANTFEMLGRSYAKLRELTPPPAATPSTGGEAADGVRAATTSGASSDATRQPEKVASPTAASPTAASPTAASASKDAPPAVERRAASGGGGVKSVHTAPAAADADPSAVYRVGPGDVLEVRVLDARESRADTRESRPNVYKVTPTGLLDYYPRLGEPLRVAGLTADEIAARLGAELKRRGGGQADGQVSVGVREYASHAIIVSGLVKDPGTKILQREGVPLYVIVAHAQPLPGAGQALVVSRVTGRSDAVNLSDAAAMNMLVRPADVITVQALPKQFIYVAGAVRQPGQREFHEGLTLTQALLAAGGALPSGASVVAVTRQGDDGRLATTRYSLPDIKNGQAPDPLVQPGDRVEVVR